MGYLFILTVSIFVTCGFASVCKARVPDDYISFGTYHGPVVQGLKESTYDAIFGYFVEAAYYTGKLFFSNESYNLIEGKTGKLIGTGWYWSMFQDGCIYTLMSSNGKISPCTNSSGYPLEKYSQFVANLNVLYPLPGQKVDPVVPNMCVGVYSEDKKDQDQLMTLGWIPGDTYDQITFLSAASNATIIRRDVREMRKLNYDPNMFKNVCKHSEIVSRSTPLPLGIIDRIGEISRKLYN